MYTRNEQNAILRDLQQQKEGVSKAIHVVTAVSLFPELTERQAIIAHHLHETYKGIEELTREVDAQDVTA